MFCRVIVGAPEDDSEQAKVGIEKAGAVYRCQTEMPFRCDQIPFDTSGKPTFLNFPAFFYYKSPSSNTVNTYVNVRSIVHTFIVNVRA